MTPWNCPRDIPEEELAKKIDDIASQVKDMKNCIFNLHCPPYNTSIDQAPKFDETLKPVSVGGMHVMVPVGSTAVRAAIEKYQPLLGLHRHIHESEGSCNIGRTLCLNHGSEYLDGIFRAAIVELDEKKVKSSIFTSG